MAYAIIDIGGKQYRVEEGDSLLVDVVAEHVKGPKLRVNTYRPKKRFKRRMGHRSHLSRLEIRKITGPTAATRAKKEPAKTEAKDD